MNNENNEVEDKSTNVGMIEFFLGIILTIIITAFIIYGAFYILLNDGKQYSTICKKEILTKINLVYTIITEDGFSYYNKNLITDIYNENGDCMVKLSNGKKGKINNKDLFLIRNFIEQGAKQ